MQANSNTGNKFDGRYDREVVCPWCESNNTKLVSPYGPSVAEMMFKCNDCENSFGWLKWEHRLPDQLETGEKR